MIPDIEDANAFYEWLRDVMFVYDKSYIMKRIRGRDFALFNDAVENCPLPESIKEIVL